MKKFTKEEVAKHNTEDDCWIIIDNKVYDMTKFLKDHPGGKKPVLIWAGKDATTSFDALHNKEDVLRKYGPQLCIGEVGTTNNVVGKPVNQGPKRTADSFGELVPGGDPSWYQDAPSPFYNESHKRFRAAMREFVDKEIIPYCHEWSENKKVAADIWEKCYKAGILPGAAGPHWYTEYAGSNIAGGVKPEEWDHFHELILQDELSRCGSGGAFGALITGIFIGLPPLLYFGSDELKDTYCPPVLQGKKKICLAITEPSAGSDVANIKTTAVKTPDGKHYIVNGEKKWITGGLFADYFTVAVRTGGEGMGGLSFLLVERGPGVTTRHMDCQGGWGSGTSYITFEDVKVPVKNLIGQENQGFKYIMYNFNHERWAIVCQANRLARVCYEEAFKYAHKRKTFGKRLIDHAVIRSKLANMSRMIEATHAWLENVTYQLKNLPPMEAAIRLGGPIALMKAQSTYTLEFCAREASQIFGGLSVSRGGQGEKIERIYREVRGFAIPGGSEEIMLDLGIRQASKISKL
eukprot:TRINITY_DN6140_c0_g1_i1.p1 TRINITY_DN6140_c0_g1~~TRINITY_DN6140_c0_g1_i1.p1  ORF type:complete len:520 (-),score=175.43 TRINITY_DN6140_c0_g1_i1:42-1601(-)